MNDKGITLTSLIIYIIGMTIIIGIISTITSFFYKNVDIVNINNDTSTEYTKFSSIFTEEINKENNYIIECKTYEENEKKISYIIFSSGNQYTFNQKNNSIYKNKIRICKNVEDCDFSYTFRDSKYFITINYKSNDFDLTNDNAITYIL